MKETDIIAPQKKQQWQEYVSCESWNVLSCVDSAAFAIARLMHYKVRCKHRRNGDVLVAGFRYPSWKI